MKKLMWIVAGVALAGLVSCNPNSPDDPSTDPVDTTGVGTTIINEGDDENDFVENQTWNSTVSIVWNGASAAVSGEVDSVSVVNENGYVVVTSKAKHVTYLLSGSGTGQMKIYSDYKFRLNLDGISLTCSDGPAINNQCKKTCYTVVSGTNVLTDGSSYATSDESQKAAFFSEGQLVFSGSGKLTITGNYKHALASDDYIRVREGELNLTAKVSDGMHANDGIIIDGGKIDIDAAGDGIQCDTSSILIRNGDISILNVGDKGMLAFGDIEIRDGKITVTAYGKGIKTKSNLTIYGGDISVICYASSHTAAPSWGPGDHDGPGGGPGGQASGPEGIEAKGVIKILGGTVYAQSPDDAINSGGDLMIGTAIPIGYDPCVCAYSTGNDGLDANGNCYIDGGIVYAIGAGSPEVAIDANSEAGCKLYLVSGTVVAIGGLESGAELTQACYSASSWSPNTWYNVPINWNNNFAFLTPESGGTPLVISTGTTAWLQSGVTVNAIANPMFNGMGGFDAVVSGGTEVSLSNYTGNSGGRPGR